MLRLRQIDFMFHIILIECPYSRIPCNTLYTHVYPVYFYLYFIFQLRDLSSKLLREAWDLIHVRRIKRINMASYETEEIDVAKEFNLLPVIFETIQALQRTSDPQELTKKVAS